MVAADHKHGFPDPSLPLFVSVLHAKISLEKEEEQRSERFLC